MPSRPFSTLLSFNERGYDPIYNYTSSETINHASSHKMAVKHATTFFVPARDHVLNWRKC